MFHILAWRGPLTLETSPSIELEPSRPNLTIPGEEGQGHVLRSSVENIIGMKQKLNNLDLPSITDPVDTIVSHKESLTFPTSSLTSDIKRNGGSMPPSLDISLDTVALSSPVGLPSKYSTQVVDHPVAFTLQIVTLEYCKDLF